METLCEANEALFFMVESLLTGAICSFLVADFSIGLASKVTFGDFSRLSGDLLSALVEISGATRPASFMTDLVYVFSFSSALAAASLGILDTGLTNSLISVVLFYFLDITYFLMCLVTKYQC